METPKTALTLSQDQITTISGIITAQILKSKQRGIEKFVIGGDYSYLLIGKIRTPFQGMKDAPSILYFAGIIPPHYCEIEQNSLYDLNQDNLSRYLQ